MILPRISTHRPSVLANLFSTISPYLNEAFPSVETCLSYYKSNPTNTIFLDPSDKRRFIHGARLPNSRFIDLEQLSRDSHPTLPNMMPSTNYFTSLLSSLDISSSHQLIIYGSDGCVTQSRLYIMLQSFGHTNISWMQGTLKRWDMLGGELDYDIYHYPKDENNSMNKYPMREYTKYILSRKEVEHVVHKLDKEEGRKIETNSQVIIDTRLDVVYRAGYIPHSINIPFITMMKDNICELKETDEIIDIFKEYGIRLNNLLRNNIIIYCNSGMTSCVVMCALVKVGVKIEKMGLYDGSWSEWKENYKNKR